MFCDRSVSEGRSFIETIVVLIQALQHTRSATNSRYALLNTPKEPLITFGQLECGLSIAGPVFGALNGTPDTAYAACCSITILPSMPIGRCRRIKGKKPLITSDLFAHASVLIAISLVIKISSTGFYFLNYESLLSECDGNAGIIEHGHSFVMLHALRTFLHPGNHLLSRGFKASAPSIIVLVVGFVAICYDIALVQMPKLDQKNPTKLDCLSRTTRRIFSGQSWYQLLKRPIWCHRYYHSREERKEIEGTWLSPGAAPARNITAIPNHADCANPPLIDQLALFFTGAACGDDVSFLYSAGRMMNKRTWIEFDTQLVVHRYHPTGMSGTRVGPDVIHGP
ncbi:hypothetical protein GYMLUDRAFT_246621 [Collybiopsis luxurians FD-317 M1]|uniref:Uncharacterized protein n=1 Tax=Collybiopsis luxurians FD-317 M1 TaxID=944289 RepID=A0A0D0CR22_9AGAR|nr:hypothetical protein GYMLUDRAFT_246621 [Collybiopsis luxurians FD-317 M1]